MKVLRNIPLLLTLTFSLFASSVHSSESVFNSMLNQECAEVPKSIVLKVITHESKSFYKGKAQPWPWTLNIDGQGYYYSSYRLALIAAIKAKNAGAKKLGVGIGQIEWKFHKERFDNNLAQALYPRNNLRVVCDILTEAWKSKKVKTWADAIAYYHRPVLDKTSRIYADKVMAL